MAALVGSGDSKASTTTTGTATTTNTPPPTTTNGSVHPPHSHTQHSLGSDFGSSIPHRDDDDDDDDNDDDDDDDDVDTSAPSATVTSNGSAPGRQGPPDRSTGHGEAEEQQDGEPRKVCPASNGICHPADGARSSAEEKEDALKEFNLPLELPTLGHIRKSLPPHVFDSSVATSLYFVAKDLAQIVLLFLVADQLWASPWFPRWVLWVGMPAYWLLQGTMFWAIFVLGHDCGHASFSRYPPLNDAVGNVLHSFLLCPYYCWKLSHRHHHAFTGNIDKDEVFYPVREGQKSQSGSFLPVFGFGTSWFIYLFYGYAPRSVNHFNPCEAMFSRHVGSCTISISMVVAWFTILLHLVHSYGILKVLILYAVPEFIFGTYLVLTTFLHHTDHGVPWYDDSLWSFVRGQLSSIDRHYGWCHSIVHNIGTHQIHHLFSTIPHYHLEEATKVFRSKFPHLVRKSDERLLPAFCRIFYMWFQQHSVPDNKLIHVYS